MNSPDNAISAFANNVDATEGVSVSSVCHASLLDRFAAAQCAESRVGGTADGSSDL